MPNPTPGRHRMGLKVLCRTRLVSGSVRDGARGPFTFLHGLGDLVDFAYQVPLYTRRGHRIAVHTYDDYAFILRAAGADLCDEQQLRHPWHYPTGSSELSNAGERWMPWLIKGCHNISAPPSPDVGRHDSLCREYFDVSLDVGQFVRPQARVAVESFLSPLPRPLFVVHAMGRPPTDDRSFDPGTALDVYLGLVQRSQGSVVVLDTIYTDVRGGSVKGIVPLIKHPRFRACERDWRRVTVEEMWCLLDAADVFVGIDSGPAHLVRATSTPAIICLKHCGGAIGVPQYIMLPRAQTTFVAWYELPSCPGYDVLHCPGGKLDGHWIADRAIERALQRPPVSAAAAPPPHGAVRIRCIGARGDVLAAASVAAPIKRQGRRIVFETAYPEVVAGHAHIDSIVPRGASLAPGELLIDLCPERQWKPREHRLATAAAIAGVGLDELIFHVPTEPVELPNGPFVVLHPEPPGEPAWKGRTWNGERWASLAAGLISEGIAVVVVGASPTVQVPDRAFDLRGKTTPRQLAFAIGQAIAFAGSESYPAIIAQCFGVPCALFFGSIFPELRVFRANVVPLFADLPCLGCHHDEPRPAITSHCRVGGEPCRAGVAVGEFHAAVRRAMKMPRAERVQIYAGH